MKGGITVQENQTVYTATYCEHRCRLKENIAQKWPRLKEILRKSGWGQPKMPNLAPWCLSATTFAHLWKVSRNLTGRFSVLCPPYILDPAPSIYYHFRYFGNIINGKNRNIKPRSFWDKSILEPLNSRVKVIKQKGACYIYQDIVYAIIFKILIWEENNLFIIFPAKFVLMQFSFWHFYFIDAEWIFKGKNPSYHIKILNEYFITVKNVFQYI